MEMTTTKGCRCTYKEHELDAVLHGAVLLIEWIFWLWLGSKPPTDSAFATCFTRRGGNGASVGYREWSCGFISIARIKHLQSGRCRIHRWENYQIGRKANFVTGTGNRSEEHTSELQSRFDLVCRLLLEKKKKKEHK